LGTIPEDGSTPVVEDYGFIIKVNKIKDRRMESAVVCLSEIASEKSLSEKDSQ
jgi:putative hemolysin